MIRIKSKFTLVELLIVISVIMILISLLLPALSNVRKTIKGISCINNLRQCNSAMLMYESDYSGFLLPNYNEGTLGARWYNNMGAYTGLKPMQCSETEIYPTVLKALTFSYNGKVYNNTGGYVDYAYNTRAGCTYNGAAIPMIKVSGLTKTSNLAYMADGIGWFMSSEYCTSPEQVRKEFAPRHLSSFNVLYLDGHANKRKPSDFGILYNECLIQKITESGTPL